MTQVIAFLRAVNVGGHTNKMEDLRGLFVGLGFGAVETFIASGNVIFEASSPDLAALESLIEARLKDAYGYAIATFIRTPAELAEIAANRPFPAAEMETAAAFNVAFTRHPLDEQAQQKLAALRTEIDDFRTHNREVYWLCRQKQSQSTFSNAVLEKALGIQSTLRGINTLRKMSAKYPPA